MSRRALGLGSLLVPLFALTAGCGAGPSVATAPEPRPAPIEAAPAEAVPVEAAPAEPVAEPAPAADPDPTADTDGDGIVDHRDTCVEAPEDMDGFEDADGCPDPDNDGDGIVDARDRCPNQAEDFDGHDDDDGCHDRPLYRYCRPMRESRYAIVEKIRFAEGGAKVPDYARPFIDELGEMMRVKRQVRVLIEGHSDSRGSTEANDRASLKRAQAVRDALIAAGALPGQLAIIAYGERAPIEDNRTPGGRAANRRVEFRAVRGPCTTHESADVPGGRHFDRDGDGRIDPLVSPVTAPASPPRR